MKTTVREVAYDVQTDLKQVFADAEISINTAIYWVVIVGNKLKALHIAKRSSGMFLNTFNGVPVQLDEKNKHYVDLPKGIFDFDGDRGIEFVSYESDGCEGCPPRFTNLTFTRTTPKMSRRLYFSRYEEPSPKNPYFYLVGQRVFFLGTEKIPLNSVDMGLFTTIDPLSEINIDEYFEFPEELIYQLKREVIDMGRFALLIPNERANTGDDNTDPKVIPNNKLNSVNQNATDTNQE